MDGKVLKEFLINIDAERYLLFIFRVKKKKVEERRWSENLRFAFLERKVSRELLLSRFLLIFHNTLKSFFNKKTANFFRKTFQAAIETTFSFFRKVYSCERSIRLCTTRYLVEKKG